MRIIPAQYECEVCRKRYGTEADAVECEARVPPNYPIGLIYGDASNKNDHHSHNMTFCVAEYTTDRHMNSSGSWACRDTGMGDSLGLNLCGLGNLELGQWDAVKDTKHPTFLRMVDYLKSMDVEPLVWDGKKAVPLEG